MKASHSPFCLSFISALLFALSTGDGLAHKVTAVSVVSDFNTKDGTFKVELAMDVDPSGDPTVDDQIPPETAARAFATESLQLYFDDQVMTVEPVIKVVTASDEETPTELVRKKAIGTLSGKIPEGSENFLLRVVETTEAAVVMVTIKDGKPARRLQVLYPGEFSNPVSLATVMEGDPFTEAKPAETPAPAPAPAAAEASSETPAPEPVVEPTPENIQEEQTGFGSWLAQGFLAVLPTGVSFWTFMLGMFLLSLRARPLGWQVGLYTVSHSLALALAAFGLVKIDASIVAPVVAISALYLVIENLFVNEMKWWRGAAIFGFGLFHGFAFSELLWTHQPRLSELLPALIGFNLGIELAQLVVLIIASIVAVSLAKRPWFRHGVVVPLCVIIAGIAFFRFIDVMWLH